MYRHLVKFIRNLVHPTGYDIVRYDPDGTVPRHLLRIFSTMGVDCVLDVGANIGQYAEMLRNEGYRGWIFSFEPLPSAFKVLSQKAANDDKWRCFPFALGSTSETREFYEYSSSTFSSFKSTSEIGKARFQESSQIKNIVKVQIRRLDEAWNEIFAGLSDKRVFLKMDTQGFDSEVFSGAAGKLDRIVALQSELSIKPIYDGMETYKNALHRYETAGYSLTGLYPVVRSKLHTLLEMDCVMVRTTPAS